MKADGTSYEQLLTGDETMNWLGDMIFLTSNALDPDNWEVVRETGLPMGEDENPLTLREYELLTEDRHQVSGIGFADLCVGHTVLFHGNKYLAPCVEFHFRNDETRHVWGTPVTLETGLPSREDQLRAANKAQERVESGTAIPSIPIMAAVQPDAYEETKDRHILWVLVPMTWALTQFPTADDYLRYMRQILSPEKLGWHKPPPQPEPITHAETA
jgi:hypothetical protein